MANTISNTDDVIDSRDVIERIEELEGMRQPWVVGWNMPGYMPDSDPSSFETWEDARDYLVEELDRVCDETDDQDDGDQYNRAARELEGLNEEEEFGRTIGKYHWWINKADHEGLDADDHAELKALQALAEQGETESRDWPHGETLIRRSYFVDYIEQLIDDCYEMPKQMHSGEWPYRHMTMDYEAAAKEAEQDYSSIDFDGEEYLIRSC